MWLKTDKIMKYYIPIHSFIDLITNSSTEIYVEATEKTIKTLRELVNEILKAGKSKLRADDLFTFSLEKNCDCYDEYDKDSDEAKEHMEHMEDCERCSTVLVVTTKKPHAPELKKVLDIMNNLMGLFEYGERYH
jgi:hypothetical protein